MKSKHVEIKSPIPDTVEIDKHCWYVQIGKGVKFGRFIALGFPGFGFEKKKGRYAKPLKRRPHPYGIIIEDGVKIDHCVVIERGRWRMTWIKQHTAIDSHTLIGHNTIIGRNVLICSAKIGGSVEVGDNCFIGINATIKDGIKITHDVFIGSGSNVVKNIDEPYTLWAGNPAKKFNTDKYIF